MSSKPKSNIFASEALASVALEASGVLFSIAKANKSPLCGNIATRLRFIADDLSCLELYRLSPETQDLSSQALYDLLVMCKWPELPASQGGSVSASAPRELRKALVEIFERKALKLQGQISIAKFCKESLTTITPFVTRFRKLSEKLTEIQDWQDTSNTIGANGISDTSDKDVYPNSVHKLLLEGVKRYALCVLSHDEPQGHKLLQKDVWHLTRLCLGSGLRSEDHMAHFNIVSSTSEMTYWQESAIFVPTESFEKINVQGIRQVSNTFGDTSDSSLIEYGHSCRQLEGQKNFARVCLYLNEDCSLHKRPDPEVLEHIICGSGIRLAQLLRQSELTVEQKIKLSHLIARAFWQLYDSDLMCARWTSEDIMFIPVLDAADLSPLEAIPLRPFVAFPIGDQYTESPTEFYRTDQYTHRYPRILHLGIMLLEIGLGQSLSLGENPKLSPLAQTNTARIKARMKLKDLKTADWDGFQWKGYFIDAIESCLDSENFKHNSKGRKHGKREVNHASRAERRDLLYDKVVAPLSWLATVGFEKWKEAPLIPIQPKKDKEPTFADNEESQSFWNEIRTRCSFLSENPPDGSNFLEDIQKIAKHIESCRRAKKMTKRIRVAILDSGCETALPFFQTSKQRSDRLKGWKDFATNSKSEVDTFGHGTFMARLLMHVAPMVDVYVIRVAVNGDELHHSQENIAKAIEYVGLSANWEVDVISMSFGLPHEPGKTYARISNAIETVRKQRNDSVVFLAAAGNSWERGKDFPASDRNVIPIYAANSKGEFLSSNATNTSKGPAKLCTYGTDIPPSIIEEIQDHFPEADLGAGSSIATAIAAGIVAMTLSHLATLPSLLDLKGSEDVCAQLCTKRGMEKMLHAMSINIGPQQQFIHPTRFWGKKTKDFDIFVSICRVVEELNEEMNS